MPNGINSNCSFGSDSIYIMRVWIQQPLDEGGGEAYGHLDKVDLSTHDIAMATAV